MQATVTWRHHDFQFEGASPDGFTVPFDSPLAGDAKQGMPPMQVLLQAAAACTSMDVIGILRKRRLTVDRFVVHASADRAETHPRVFTRVHFHIEIDSPDVTEAEMERAVRLSQETYCPIAYTLRAAGVPITWDAVIGKP